MKKSVCGVIAFLSVTTVVATKPIWSEETPLIAQSRSMEHQMHGADKPQMQPIDEMKMKGKGENKPHDHHEHHQQMNVPSNMPPRSTLKPAEGASVKILSPRPGQVFKGDEVPLTFRIVKGKRGHHVHAYVGEELMGMFRPDEGTLKGKGTLTGIQPGHHTLELRVVTEDHKTELDATDRIRFMVK
jgi:hypothetical protein